MTYGFTSSSIAVALALRLLLLLLLSERVVAIVGLRTKEHKEDDDLEHNLEDARDGNHHVQSIVQLGQLLGIIVRNPEEQPKHVDDRCQHK